MPSLLVAKPAGFHDINTQESSPWLSRKCRRPLAWVAGKSLHAAQSFNLKYLEFYPTVRKAIFIMARWVSKESVTRKQRDSESEARCLVPSPSPVCACLHTVTLSHCVSQMVPGAPKPLPILGLSFRSSGAQRQKSLVTQNLSWFFLEDSSIWGRR